MNRVIKFLKAVYRKLFLKEAANPLLKQPFYDFVPKENIQERTFYYGREKFKINSLQMEAAPGTSEMVVKMLKALPQERQLSLLDFGCGQHQSRYLKNLGFEVHSCDVLKFDIPNFVQIDPKAAALPFPDNRFDLVVASEVLEHVESPWALLKELLRVARLGVVITTPNPSSLKSREVFARTGFLHWFTQKDFSYHISPIFWWQVQLFCERHNVKLAEMAGNHQAFGLPDGGRPVDYAEALIYRIQK